MPPHHDVLRLHGLFQHADWVENLAIHLRYENQDVYFARVSSVLAAVALLELPCPISRGFPDHGLSCSSDVPALFIGKGHGKAPCDVESASIKTQFCCQRARKCGHAAFFARTKQSPGVDQGSIPG